MATRPSDDDFRQLTRLGETIAEQGWERLHGIPTSDVLMSYDPPTADVRAGDEPVEFA